MRLRPLSVWLLAATLGLTAHLHAAPVAEGLSLLHVGDQESWLVSAQGNLRDDPSQATSFYGGIDRLASVIARESAAAGASGRSVLKINAGDAFLPGPRFNASLQNLQTGFQGGQDYYDAIAMRQIGFTATVFGNHEFDLGPATAARFAEVSGSTYLSSNIDFSTNPDFAGLETEGKVGASMVVTTDAGNRIGIVGVTTPLLPTISSPGDVGLLNYTPGGTERQNLDALAPLVQAQVDAVRAQGATAVVVVSHLQNVQNELNVLVPQLRGVDLVVSGGGHELMANSGTPLVSGEAAPLPPLDKYPQVVRDADGRPVLTVTSNFGNRYLGVLNVSLDANGAVVRDAQGVPVVDAGSGMRRVSGAGADADRVAPDATLLQSVVTPVREFIRKLNAEVIGRSDVPLNGSRGAPGTPAFQPGVRNSETNLGNLVADALRWIAGTDVALQNGGGIRASVATGPVSVGDTFNVLTFTNLVVAARTVTAEQLRGLLEHGLGAASPTGDANGRFPQIAGLQVVYDSARAIGNRVVSLVLDDGTVLVRDGAVVPGARAFSLATIDFLASGGDGYPFAPLGIDVDNLVTTITYQEALADFISAPVAEGGLGGLVSAARYAVTNPFDAAGRLVDLAIARPNSVPEAGSLALLALALALLALGRVRRAGRWPRTGP